MRWEWEPAPEGEAIGMIIVALIPAGIALVAILISVLWPVVGK